MSKVTDAASTILTGGQARVVVSFGRQWLIDIGDGEARRCKIKGRSLRPLCGDEVMYEPDTTGQPVIVSVLPRRNELLRHDLRRGSRAIAANLDQLVIVTAPEPSVALTTVDRYLAGAEILGMDAVILRNKSDIGKPPGTDEDWQHFSELGYAVIDVSAKSEAGLDALRAQLTNKVSAFIGPSGTGKSSLLTALDSRLGLRTQTLSKGSGEGRHTTTATRWYQIPGGADVIDSPGVRDFRLWPMETLEVQHGFREFNRLRDLCRFPNCSHRHEPGCAVIEAAEKRTIPKRRYESYKTLCSQLENGITAVDDDR